jgi:hypothetical protein
MRGERDGHETSAGQCHALCPAWPDQKPKKRIRAETMGGLLNCAQKEEQDCIEMLTMLDNHSEEWDAAMEEYKVAKSEVRSFMTQLSHLATLNDGKRSANEEITDNFVESLRQG